MVVLSLHLKYTKEIRFNYILFQTKEKRFYRLIFNGWNSENLLNYEINILNTLSQILFLKLLILGLLKAIFYFLHYLLEKKLREIPIEYYADK